MVAIFVDMGETLVRFKPRFHESIANAIREEGIEVSDIEVFKALMRHLGKNCFPHPQFDGLSQIDFKDLFYELNLHIPNNIIKKLENKNYLADEYELYDDAIPFLENVRELGFKTILVTNTTKKVNKIIKDLNLDNYLDGIIASCDYNILKPHPKIFYYAKKLAGSEGIHIGDVYEIDVLGARRAYMKAILLDRLNLYPEIKNNKVTDLYEALNMIQKLELTYT